MVDQLPRFGKRDLICLLLFTCNYVVSVWRGFLFLWVLGMGYVILLWHSLSLPYNYFVLLNPKKKYITCKSIVSKCMAGSISDSWVNIGLFYGKVKFGRLCVLMEKTVTKLFNGKESRNKRLN